MISAVLALTIVGVSLFVLQAQSRNSDKRSPNLAPVRVRVTRPRLERRRVR